MATLFSNIPLTKETPQETILNIVITGNETITIVDKTNEVYQNATKLYRNLRFVKKEFNEYQVQLLPMIHNDGTVVGLYTAEGYDFELSHDDDPIFFIQKSKVDLTLKGFYDKSKEICKIGIGMFTPNTIIRYKVDGVPYVDRLTINGWNSKNDFKSVSDVAQEAKANKGTNTANVEEKLKAAEELCKAGEITKDLYERFKIFLIGYQNEIKDGKMLLNTFTLQEAKLLTKKGLK